MGTEKILILSALFLLALIPSYLWVRHFKEKLPARRWQIILFLVLLYSFSVLCAKLFAAIEFWDIKAFVTGMRIYGSMFLPPIAAALAFKLLGWHKRFAFDVMTVCQAFSMMIFRFNCYIQNCCYGMHITESGSIRWPIREAEIVLFIALIIWFAWHIIKGKSTGTLYPLFMIIYGIFRFAAEYFRVEYVSVGALHVAHLWSLLSIAVGITAYVWVSEYSKKEQNKINKKVKRRS